MRRHYSPSSRRRSPSAGSYDSRSRSRANSEDEEDYSTHYESGKKHKEKKEKKDKKDKKEKKEKKGDSGDERRKLEKEDKERREGGKGGEKRREKESHSGGGSSDYGRREDEHWRHEYVQKDDRPDSYGEERRYEEHSRRFPGEHGGYGKHQESHGYGERPNMQQAYGHPGSGYAEQPAYGSQPQTYQTPPPPSVTYGSGQGAHVHNLTSSPPVQYQSSGYQQNAYGGGGAYSGSTYQPGPSQPPPQGEYGAAYGGFPLSGPPGASLPQNYGHGYHPQEQSNYEFRPQEQPASYVGYNQPSPAQGPYVGYQAPPGPPPGTPGYHSPTPPTHSSHGFYPPPQTSAYNAPSPAYNAPSPAYNAPAPVYNAPAPVYNAPAPVYNAPSPAYDSQSTYNTPPSTYNAQPAYDSSYPYGGPSSTHPTTSTSQNAPAGVAAGAGAHAHKPQHNPAQQHQQESLLSGTGPANVSSGAPANPAKPGGGVLNTFTSGLNSALHGYARTLFPVTTTHNATVPSHPDKPAASLGASGESGAPAQITDERFDSFAPVRGGNAVKWYVDGKDYMYAVSIALENARESIWILDWWLSPEIYLRRPRGPDDRYRLDSMLFQAANRGVKVNIIVYKEVTQALTRKSLKPVLSPYISSLISKHTPTSSKPLSLLSSLASDVALPLAFHGLEILEAKYPLLYPSDASGFVTVNSSHTKHHLEDMHQNIAVFRHPDHLPDRPTVQQDIWKKISGRNTYSIGDGLKALYGMSNDVVLYWAHHEKLCLVDGEIAFMGGLDLCFGRWDTNNHPIADAHPGDINQVLFIGQDYNNARLMDFHTVEEWDQNKVSRTESSRMGWTDVALSFMGPTVVDLQRHFIERWNYIYTEKYEIRNDKRFSPLEEIAVDQHRQHYTKGQQEERAYGHGHHADLVGVQCQIVRSASKWSHGLPVTEHSICQAYIEIILAAEHFVYIENQFFITATDDRQRPIINKIGLAIVQRILTAVKRGEKFRVIVVMPAVPAFAGDLEDDGSLGTRAIMEFQYRSICRDNNLSIIEQIAKAGVNPMEYIRFYNLRNYDRINTSRTMEQVQQASGVPYGAAAAAYDGMAGGGYGQGTHGYGNPRPDDYPRYQQMAPGGSGEWDSVSRCVMLNGDDIRTVPWEGDPEREMDAFVSEELYVHSKLLIADDRTVICGSANLNDRSQLGDHDSEIAIIIDDPTELPSYMNGKPYIAKQFAATLRRQIFRKHLGLIPAQEMSDSNRNMWPIFVPERGERDFYRKTVPNIITNCYDFDSYEDSLVADPLGDFFWNLWNNTARTNTEVFTKAFHAVPNDCVRNWPEYREFYSKYFVPTAQEKLRAAAETKDRVTKATAAGQPKPEDVKPKAMIEYGHVVKSEFSPGQQGMSELKELLSRVKGHLVEMPLHFLEQEDIAKEGLGLNALTETLYT